MTTAHDELYHQRGGDLHSAPSSEGGAVGAGGAFAIAAAMTASISADVGGREEEKEFRAAPDVLGRGIDP